MRLFTGLDVPYEIRRNLELLLHHLRPTADIAWSPLANLHITTKFIGEWPESRLEELKSALAGVARPGVLPISIRGLGFFPTPRQPRVFYAGIDAGPELPVLASHTDAAAGAGENKPYSPHLTLARIKRPTELARLHQAIAQLPGVDFGRFEAAQFHLYLSELRPSGSVYTKLASFPLSK
jgi:RNA 2',3'-cyclic 3'-phosphodiesterase